MIHRRLTSYVDSQVQGRLRPLPLGGSFSGFVARLKSFNPGLTFPAMALVAIFSGACWAGTSVGYVEYAIEAPVLVPHPPPPPRIEPQPMSTPPTAGLVWRPGYWTWSKTLGEYRWIASGWVLPPEPGMVFYTANYVRIGTRGRWTPCYWGHRRFPHRRIYADPFGHVPRFARSRRRIHRPQYAFHHRRGPRPGRRWHRQSESRANRRWRTRSKGNRVLRTPRVPTRGRPPGKRWTHRSRRVVYSGRPNRRTRVTRQRTTHRTTRSRTRVRRAAPSSQSRSGDRKKRRPQ